MASETDLFHRKVGGHLGKGNYCFFKVGGRTFRVGGASFFQVEFSWDEDYAAAERFAPVRGYKFTTDGSGNEYGALFMYGWMLNYPQLVRIPGYDSVVPAWALAVMAANHNIYVDSDWLVTDGFEVIQQPVPKVYRIEVDDAGTLVSAIPTANPTSMGLIGRVSIKKAGKRPTEISDWCPWPADVSLAEFVAPGIATARSTKQIPLQRIPPAEADAMPPDIFEPLSGGPQHEDGEVLMKVSTPWFVIFYAYMDPAVGRLRYARLVGDLHADPLSGEQMFDEAALRHHATDVDTVAELKRSEKTRLALNTKYMLPGLNGLYPVVIPRAWIRDEYVTVAPNLGMAAKWAVGTSNYFTFEWVVGHAGKLVGVAPLSRFEEMEHTVSSFVRGRRREINIFHMQMSALLDAKVSMDMRTEPFDIAIPSMSESTYAALMQHCGMTAYQLKNDASILEHVLTPMMLDKFIGYTVAPLHTSSTSMKKPDWYMVHPGNGGPARGNAQPQGTFRRSLHDGTGKLRISLALFKGRTLVHGFPPEQVPDYDPPAGDRWAYSLAVQDYVPAKTLTTSKRELRELYPHMSAWEQHAVGE